MGRSRSWQFQRGLLRSAMVAVLQRLDARSFSGDPQLSVFTLSTLVLKVFRNRSGCHGVSVAELAPSKLYNFGHSVTISCRLDAPRKVSRDLGTPYADPLVPPKLPILHT